MSAKTAIWIQFGLVATNLLLAYWGPFLFLRFLSAFSAGLCFAHAMIMVQRMRDRKIFYRMIKNMPLGKIEVFEEPSVAEKAMR